MKKKADSPPSQTVQEPLPIPFRSPHMQIPASRCHLLVPPYVSVTHLLRYSSLQRHSGFVLNLFSLHPQTIPPSHVPPKALSQHPLTNSPYSYPLLPLPAPSP